MRGRRKLIRAILGNQLKPRRKALKAAPGIRRQRQRIDGLQASPLARIISPKSAKLFCQRDARLRLSIQCHLFNDRDGIANFVIRIKFNTN